VDVKGNVVQGERMKRTAIIIIIAMLGISAGSFAQNKPAAQTAPAGQAAAPAGNVHRRPRRSRSLRRIRLPWRLRIQRHKRKPRTISRRSFLTASLRPLLYKSVMHSYQQANNADKMMAMSPESPEL